MTRRADPVRIFTERNRSYVRFIRSVRYPQGIRAYFLAAAGLRSRSRVLDAGCGTGVVMLALRDALIRRGMTPGVMQAFDLTPTMLRRFQQTLAERRIYDVETAQADVLDLTGLPTSWRDYDLIVSASMLEYVPPQQLTVALRGLRSLLRDHGRFVLFITRRNWLTRPLIGRWWQGHLYTADELDASLRQAGFAHVGFHRFSPAFRYLGLWGHVVEAAGGVAT